MAMCELTGKKTVVKNLVSHSNIKTKSKALLNIKKKHLRSLVLKQNIRFKIAASTLRDIDHKGGLDPFLIKQPDSLLSKKALKFKNQILKKMKIKKETPNNLKKSRTLKAKNESSVIQKTSEEPSKTQKDETPSEADNSSSSSSKD